MVESERSALHPEFGRLAMARSLVTAGGSTGRVDDDRRNAERWVGLFGGEADLEDEAHEDQERRSVVIYPEKEAPGSPWVLYLHGGGMVYYSTSTFRPYLRILADRLGAPVEALDYDKAPEHDVMRSVADLAARIAGRCREVTDRPLIVAGDSVGGLLALYLGVRVLPRVFSRIVLIYPVLDLDVEHESYQAFGTGYFLDGVDMRYFTSLLQPFFREIAFNPMDLSDSDLSALAGCSIVTSGCDVLRDEGLEWARYVADRSADVRHLHFPDLPHDFCLYAPKLSSARRAVEQIAGEAFVSGDAG
ncbi:alpha/beta hydrolase fold domain-containing protein [Oerskovia paurometabola]|uniref:Alpha/beta hydrolase fold domain-containing protein n=1 Tax=Oerskovia paurometabola TaxID=162170 RepID=A0ABW1X6C2_9CELL|nr:alpha/beta hydrolase fold domain-containing protein [Oerskovia paurometabola]MBM7495841.1 acetyl esterase/lipase [Oerskovia paurometabola]